MKFAAYVYPGWHACRERDRHFPEGFSEWDLVTSCKPRFEGHAQPRLPLWGPYDDSDPTEVERRISAAVDHGIDLFVHGFFWCRGKQVFREALDRGYLGCDVGKAAPFAILWANRMPRHILPVKRADLPVLDPARAVDSDVEDFVDLVSELARSYFRLPNYHHLGGKAYFSIYDSTFFVRELGNEGAREAIASARDRLAEMGLPGLHLACVDPAPGYAETMREVGFDSVTSYVLLPYWKGPFLQDYSDCARRRAAEWEAIASASGLDYHPSVSPGWDASPRGADFGAEKPRKYPWWPVVTGENPERFRKALLRASRYAADAGGEDPHVFIASLNEWSEGHYLEPDTRFGMGWLEAVRDAKADLVSL